MIFLFSIIIIIFFCHTICIFANKRVFNAIFILLWKEFFFLFFYPFVILLFSARSHYSRFSQFFFSCCCSVITFFANRLAFVSTTWILFSFLPSFLIDEMKLVINRWCLWWILFFLFYYSMFFVLLKMWNFIRFY